MRTKEESSDQTLALLDNIHNLLETLTRIAVFESLNKELTDEAEAKAYRLTGKNTVTKIVKESGLSSGKISGLWQRWHKMGLLRKDGKKYSKTFEAT